MKRRAALAGATAYVSCVLHPQPLRAQATSLAKIRVAGIPSDGLTPLFYGMHNGMFQKAGLDVDFVTTGNGASAITGVVGGTYEMSFANVINAMHAHLRGVPLVLVAPEGIYTATNPVGLLQIAADSQIRSGADLNGKIIGALSLNSLVDLSTSMWVDKNGGDSRTLKFVELPYSATEAAIVQHRVDAALMLEPLLTESLISGKTKTLGDSLGSIASRYLVGAYMVRPDWASQNAELVRTFVRVLADATAFTNTHPAETVQLMTQLTKIPLPIMQKMKRVLSTGTLEPALVQPLIDAAAKYRVISQAFPARDFFWKEPPK